MKNAKKQRNCKICKSEYSQALLYLHYCEHLSYRQLIERYEHRLTLNEYNLSCHFHRHVEQKDIEEVEKLRARPIIQE